MYQAIFFDLDGTLLPIDTRAFMRGYFGALGAFFADEGLDGAAVLEGVRVGTDGMFAYDGATTNAQRFWDAFCTHMGGDRAAWEPLFERFYAEKFPLLGQGIEPDPLAARVVDVLRAKGYRLALLTNPLFPPQATAMRLAWTGADPAAFCHVTAYHNSRYAKPAVEYYAENLDRLGLDGAGVLMVGNDPEEDGAACALGCDLYLVTDNLVDRAGDGSCLEGKAHGTMADLLALVRTFPEARA